MRTDMGHTAVSATQASLVTLYIWRNGAKEKYFNFVIFNRIVGTKTKIIQTEPNI